MSLTAIEQPPLWLAEFIGVPYREGGYTMDGWACWGPVYEAYRRRGILMPTYSGQMVTTEADQVEVRALVNRDRSLWREIPLTEARLWDVLTFRLAGRWHCGLVIEPPWFLHCMAKSCTTRERWDASAWRTILTGAFRWEEAADGSRAAQSAIPIDRASTDTPNLGEVQR